MQKVSRSSLRNMSELFAKFVIKSVTLCLFSQFAFPVIQEFNYYTRNSKLTFPAIEFQHEYKLVRLIQSCLHKVVANAPTQRIGVCALVS